MLALIFPVMPEQQLAIDTDFLNRTPLYRDRVGSQNILVLTDATGANRVYDPKDIEFDLYDRDGTVVDSLGNEWKLTEDKLISADGVVSLHRLPHRRAFWFGWHAAFPNTRLVH